ncbi:MAG TPA: efflux RND transporter permease subunit [Gemmatimonadota bacterium]|nr:efflux RND transporter permease subunit [Gemmatimonadota bacterium]
MRTADTAIRRPIFTIMLMTALVLFGVLGYRALGINQFPDVDFPTVTVTTILSGASPEVIESAVTDVIENELSSIEGIKHITSTSRLGVSNITVEFELDRDIDIAAQDVRAKVSVAEADLPRDTEPPTVSKLDISAQPIMWIAVSGPDPQSIGEFARWTLRPRLQTVEGVGNILLGGYREREVRIWVDRDKLEGYDLTAGELVTALQQQNVEVPGGNLESGARETLVKIQGEVPTVDEFAGIIVAYRDGAPIRVGDVARVEDGLEPSLGAARYNRQTTLGLGIAPRSGANSVAVARAVHERLEELGPSFPESMRYDIAWDGSETIERSIADAQFELLYGAFFAMVVVLLFLRSWRSTIIIGLAIPTSLIGTFGFMDFFGFTMNTFTVLALALAVGIVIDDAIVVLENIYRHMEEGTPPQEAASVATDEIALAVAATTFSLAAVFLPVAFMEGIVGRFLFEFGVTVAVAIILSLVVALTLTPMLCSRILHHEERRRNVVFKKIGEALDWTDARYRTGLDWVMAHRWSTVGIAVLATVVGGVLFFVLPKELQPEVDESGFVVASETSVASSIEYTDQKQKELEDVVATIPEVDGFFSAIGLWGGSNQGFMFVSLSEPGERDRSQQEVMDELRGRLNGVPGIRAFVSTFGSAFTGGGDSEPFQWVIQGPDLTQLNQYAEMLMTRLREEVPGLVDLRTDMRLQKPEVRVQIDRDKASAMGVDVSQIANTINVLIGRQEATIYKEGGHRYDVRVGVEDAQRNQPADIATLATRAANGELVRLGNIVSLEEDTGINVINRRDRQRAIKIVGNLEGGTSLGEAVDTADRISQEILPDGYATAVTGASETFQETLASMLFALLLATVITYMLLASQFESMIHPFTIMVAVPLAGLGALGLLLLTGQSVNLYSFIGLILLIGLVVKNSILLVDYTNQLRRRGMPRDEAIKQAGPVRLRPILMTSLTVIFGVLPIALGLSEGAELRQPMAIAVIGGLTTSTFLTLLVIPVVYSLMDDGIVWAKARVGALQRHGWRGAWSPARPAK